MTGNALPQHLVDHARCGAHCRTTGLPCRQPAMRNGRCKMHGGKAGRKPTHGRYSKDAIELLREAKRLTKILRDILG